MEWPIAFVVMSVLIGGASVARALIWARVHIREIEMDMCLEHSEVHDELIALREEVDGLKAAR